MPFVNAPTYVSLSGFYSPHWTLATAHRFGPMPWKLSTLQCILNMLCVYSV